VGALGVPGGFLALLCPALILFFLLRVTGIPATEAHALESRGEEYRRYQKEVSSFVPLPPRKDRGT
jgi:steroid 5-alpha reductase family enzyme